MDKYLYWLDNIVWLGNKSKRKLLEHLGTGEAVYKAKESELGHILTERRFQILQSAKKDWDIEKEYESMKEKGIHMLTMTEEGFPKKLKDIPDPPFCLYYKGSLPEENLPSIAVVGARECSEYGGYIARELGRCLGEKQIQVISGMARGIDGISQWAALEAGGSSYGVLGCGVDVCYPKSNQKLYERLQQKGGILSVYPPGTKPLSQFFPPRNRIVSGLADVLVVIEARQKSGTGITVEMALEQGKDIYAVPGRVTDRLSDGCNKMLREGAHVFLSPQDFLLELYQLLPEKMARIDSISEKRITEGLEKTTQVKERSTAQDRILEVLDFYPQYIDVIAESLEQKYQWKVSLSELNTLLLKLSLSDQVKQESPGWFLKSRKSSS